MSKQVRKGVVVGAALLAGSFAAHAAQPFDVKAFQEAQAAGKSILVDVTAPWCPTCTQQRSIIERLEREKPNLVVYELDFDSAKPVLKWFHVQYQSTLILFQGGQEIGRSIGETDPDRIRGLVDMAR